MGSVVHFPQVCTMVCARDFLNLPSRYTVHSLVADEGQVVVTLMSLAEEAPCPLCYLPSAHLHSHYQRTLADVPSGGRRVVLHVTTHRWRCLTPTCSRQIFAERLDDLAQVKARMTLRFVTALQAIGIATNGEAGTRLAARLGMHTSPATTLQRIMELANPEPSAPEEIGVDDWSYRRGRRFGTIIVDLQRRTVIDLLPDREAATVAAWLQRHPSVRLVSRDRSHEFANAITLGAPQAIQVLDRFHLLKNLVDLLPAILARCIAELRHAAHPDLAPHTVFLMAPVTVPPLPPTGTWKPALAPLAEARRLARQHERHARYAHLMQLHEQGFSSEEIGQQMSMSARTVRSWLQHFQQDTRKRKRTSSFDPHAEYVRQRWNAGCHNGLALWRELQVRGYTGSSHMVYRYLRPLRHLDAALDSPSRPVAPPHPTVLTPPPDLMTALHQYTLTQTQWLLVHWAETLPEKEQEYLKRLYQIHPTLAHVYSLVQQFRRLVQEQADETALTAWTSACQSSGVRELVRFARGLRTEWPSVLAGLTHPASNGQTEGHVNKLKVIKRQMYGRAGFALLRQRVLHAA